MSNRYKVMECWINRVSMDSAVSEVRQHAATNGGGYVCFSNVHSIVTSMNDEVLRGITNTSFMSMPDGKPVAAIAKLCGLEGVSQVAGPDFMRNFLVETRSSRHYLFGSTIDTLDLLISRLKSEIPGLNIVGSFSPPFESISEAEKDNNIDIIKESEPDYIWVGLGAPKQEYWMSENWEKLRPAILFGVGAAFDFHAGTKPRAPMWMRHIGLEWFHRLASEPRRLWRRYLYTNFIFIFAAIKMVLNNCRSSYIDRQ